MPSSDFSASTTALSTAKINRGPSPSVMKDGGMSMDKNICALNRRAAGNNARQIGHPEVSISGGILAQDKLYQDAGPSNATHPSSRSGTAS